MSDRRSRREKLEAMASQTVSPHEAAIARRMLGKSPIIHAKEAEGRRRGPSAYQHPSTYQQAQALYEEIWRSFTRNPYMPEGMTFCPGCAHAEDQHAGGQCYECGMLRRIGPLFCGWVILGEGNAYGLSPGWHNLKAT